MGSAVFVLAQVAGKMQISDTSLHIPRFPNWLIYCFLPYQLFFLITGGQLAWTNTFREALFPIYISFTGFLLSQPYLYLCSIQEVIKLKAKANVRVIMRQIRLKRSFVFFFKDLTHTWSACWPTASGKFPFLLGYSQKSDHVKKWQHLTPGVCCWEQHLPGKALKHRSICPEIVYSYA